MTYYLIAATKSREKSLTWHVTWPLWKTGSYSFCSRVKEQKPFWRMAFYTYYSFLLLLVIIIVSLVCSDGVDAPGSDQADKQNQMPSLSFAEAQNWPGFSSLFSLNLLSSFPEDAEISEYCRELLRVFGQRYVAYVNCLIPAARPVKVCQSCFSSNVSLVDIYRNISEEVCDARAISFCFKPSPVWQHKALFVCRRLVSHESCDWLVVTLEETLLLVLLHRQCEDWDHLTKTQKCIVFVNNCMLWYSSTWMFVRWKILSFCVNMV